MYDMYNISNMFLIYIYTHTYLCIYVFTRTFTRSFSQHQNSTKPNSRMAIFNLLENYN